MQKCQYTPRYCQFAARPKQSNERLDHHHHHHQHDAFPTAPQTPTGQSSVTAAWHTRQGAGGPPYGPT